MLPENMLPFLTKESVSLHLEYMKELGYKHSIWKKSLPSIIGKTPAEISRMNIRREHKKEILDNLIEYLSHKTYFSSFAKNDKPIPNIRDFYSSENAFCYEVLEKARVARSDFLYIFSRKGKKPEIVDSAAAPFAYIKEAPTLALDLREHAYFQDYGYARGEYLRRAVARLDISALFSLEEKALDIEY